MPPLFLCKKRNQARTLPKSVPKAYEHSETKTAAACFSFGFRLISAVGKCVGERGGGVALLRKRVIL